MFVWVTLELAFDCGCIRAIRSPNERLYRALISIRLQEGAV